MNISRFSKIGRYAVMILVVGMVLIGGGCASSAEKSKLIRIGMHTWPGFEAFMLAKERGTYDDRVQVLRIDCATDVVRAFKSDIIDVACVTADEAVRLAAEAGEPFRIVAVLDISHGGHGIVGSEAITSMTDLEGKRIGVESTALGAYMLIRAVELSEGLRHGYLRVIPVNVDRQYDTFARKNVDAVVTCEPVKSRLLREGGHLLFDSTMIPGEIIDVLIVKEKTIVRYAGRIQEVVDGWFDTANYITKHRQRAIAQMAGYEHLNSDMFVSAYEGLVIPSLYDNRTFLSGDEPMMHRLIEKLQKVLHENGLIRAEIDSRTLYTDRFVKGH